MKVNISKWALFALVFLMTYRAYGQSAVVIGDAYDLNSNEPVYTETHCVEDEIRFVEYTAPDGELLAHKKVNYATGRMTPSFTQINTELGDVINVIPSENNISMVRQKISDQPNVGVKTKRLNKRVPLVVDAGFDQFFITHWDELLAGKTMLFEFPVASRVDLFNFKISQRSCQVLSPGQACFDLRLANWLLKMLVKPIQLSYETESKRLMEYRGLSNIENENGEGYEVSIRYRYEDLEDHRCEADRSVFDDWS